MDNEIEKLKIPNPCPFVPTRFNKSGENYYCKSCTKIIVDFRGKSISEIKSTISKNGCGIFTSDQVRKQPKMTFTRQLLFNSLVFLSIIGFSVKPLLAQNNIIHSDSTSVNFKTERQDSTQHEKVKEEKVKKRKWARIFSRKKKFKKVATGCWEF